MKQRPSPASAAVILACACGIGMFNDPSPLWASKAARSDPGELRTVDIFRQLAPATLFVSTTYETTHPLTTLSSKGVGAGFIVDTEGKALTNAHVVDGASTIIVTLYDGTSVSAELLALDPTSDVAILQLPKQAKPFTPVQFGNSDRLQVGQHTLVVGSPFGLGFTLTSGIISGFGPEKTTNGAHEGQLIQTTAPINPGNSGGPLVDAYGRVIGMTSATLMGAQNIGFAIPINVAKDLLVELREKGAIERPWLGVIGQFVTDEVITLFRIPLKKGMLVVELDEAGPGVYSGLRTGNLHVVVEREGWVFGGDIITSVAGQPVQTREAFRDAIKSLRVGQKVSIGIFRNGKDLEETLLVGERPFGSMISQNGPSHLTAGRSLANPMGLPIPYVVTF